MRSTHTQLDAFGSLLESHISEGESLDRNQRRVNHICFWNYKIFFDITATKSDQNGTAFGAISDARANFRQCCGVSASASNSKQHAAVIPGRAEGASPESRGLR
jgi:hypothetical protein